MISATSIRSKLYNIAQKENIAFQVIVVRYLHERLLYRLSVSEYAGYFYLKGGNFIYALQGLLTRPTVDIDFLGWNIPNDMEEIVAIFKEILSIKFEDAVTFDSQKIKALTITEHREYNGVRLSFPASIDTIRQNIQIDIGFGDEIVPKPKKIAFPTLIKEIPAPKLFSYTIETAIAEKFQTMIFLGPLNSRMKDFYDLYKLLTTEKIDDEVMKQAIQTTFKNRGTILPADHSVFSEEFLTDPGRVKMWKAFLKKISNKENISFPEVMGAIEKHLKTEV